MSIERTKSEIMQHKNKTIQALDTYLNSLVETNKKKADLLSYWLNTYVNFLKFEEVFDPKRNKRYERGDVIRVDLGFNIGSEHGGLHYAMVLDNHNAVNSPVVTIIPLSSSDGTNVRNSEVYLGSDIYQKITLKIKGMMQTIKSEQREIEELKRSVDFAASSPNPTINNISASASLLEHKRDVYKKKTSELSKILAEASKMKKGSVALIGQITTISKIRIVDPRNCHGVLNNIKLSPENLNLINEKICELYIKGKKYG